MHEFIAFESHKHYTWVEREEVHSRKIRQCRIGHSPGAIRRALADCEASTEVAVEADGQVVLERLPYRRLSDA